VINHRRPICDLLRKRKLQDTRYSSRRLIVYVSLKKYYRRHNNTYITILIILFFSLFYAYITILIIFILFIIIFKGDCKNNFYLFYIFYYNSIDHRETIQRNNGKWYKICVQIAQRIWNNFLFYSQLTK